MASKQKLPPFILKTYQLVSDPTTDHIVSWDEDGKSFTVWNPSEFSATILPQHFKHNNYCSFVRQLNIYGFHKVHPEKWVFKHENEYFVKGDESQLNKIVRKKQIKRKGKETEEKVTKEKKLDDDKAEQKNDLYSIGFDVTNLKKTNDVLLTELNSLREMYETQSTTVTWLIQELQKTKTEVSEMKSSLLPTTQLRNNQATNYIYPPLSITQSDRIINLSETQRNVTQNTITTTEQRNQIDNRINNSENRINTSDSGINQMEQTQRILDRIESFINPTQPHNMNPTIQLQKPTLYFKEDNTFGYFSDLNNTRNPNMLYNITDIENRTLYGDRIKNDVMTYQLPENFIDNNNNNTQYYHKIYPNGYR